MKLEREIQEKEAKQRRFTLSIAKKHNEVLADISQIRLLNGYSGKKIVFEFSVEAILEDKQKEEL